MNERDERGRVPGRRTAPARERAGLPARAPALALVALLILGLVGASPLRAGAQEQPTTTTTEPPTTTAPPTTGPPAEQPAPPPETTTTQPQQPPPPPPSGGQPAEDSGPGEVPQDEVVVPPPEGPQEPDPLAPLLKQLAGISLAEVQKSLRQAAAARAAAAGQMSTLGREVAELEARLLKLESEQAQAVARLQQSRMQLRKRAVAGYMGSPASPINQILDATDFNDLSRRFELLRAVVEADRVRIDEYNAAKEAVGNELDGVVAKLDAKRSAMLVAGSVLDGADSALLAKQIQLAAVRAGGNAVGGGFVFPVGGPHSYSDTFGAPRMFGTAYAHLHEGTDIFAASGTPLLAVERGVLIRVGSDTLGGTKLWLVGASGTRYYYAHLSAFAEGVAEGKVVAAGDVVGFVGNTGNAATTPAHLHFEVHPNGGPAVNPYPLLRIVDDAAKRLAASRPPQGPGGSGPGGSNTGPGGSNTGSGPGPRT
ncbi:MAG: peptidoglycan DD-metalloendopeptidase family protein [Actinobacteria bacterium]|nr:peptidoglycan DD-metalloendopeptidase family protein [Actinomycetota bacterium]